MTHFESNSLLSPRQHGGRNFLSTTTNLIIVLDRVFSQRDQGLSVAGIYFEFSKAFDVVNHAALLFKLAAYGVGGDILNWSKSWLTGRRARVRVNNCQSLGFGLHHLYHKALFWALFSILLMSMIYFNLFNVIRLCSLMTSSIHPINNDNDYLTIQNDINTIVRWCENFDATLNVSKSALLLFGPSICSFFINNSVIDQRRVG
eukprot:GHVN01026360.1.p1 GENE.GHVN01026360.1~~GHVN01026360.1.p1  ORF type:complete len:203 (+),score=8.21 GHVN01026360.1:275-883(+)